jgi:hypothetical protein
MAINYNAGFLPQELYNNIGRILQQGYDQQAENDRRRMQNLGSIAGTIGGAFMKSNIDKGDKARENLTRSYETKRKGLMDQMALLDPRTQDFKNYQSNINMLDREYEQAISQFDQSGFLGKLGRDQSSLNIGDVQAPGYSPDSTRSAYALRDATTRLENELGTKRDALLPDMKARIAATNDPTVLAEEERLYNLGVTREDLKRNKAQEDTLEQIRQRGQNSLNLAGVNNAAAMERTLAGQEGRADYQKLQREYLQAQIEGQRERDAAQLKILEARANAATQKDGQVKTKDLLTMARNMVKDRYGENPIDPVTYEDEVLAAYNFLSSNIGQGGGAPAGPQAPTAESLYAPAEKSGADKEEPKITKIPRQRERYLQKQVEDLLDRADGIFGFGQASPEMMQHTSTLVTNQRRAIQMYNATPDSDKEKKEQLRNLVNQYSIAINEAATKL